MGKETFNLGQGRDRGHRGRGDTVVVVSMEDIEGGRGHISVGRRDIIMETVRTDTGNWKLYTARGGNADSDERHSAITYSLEQEFFWAGAGAIWPSINTPYGVFRTCESVVQPHQTRMEWEIVSHTRKPPENVASNRNRIYIWGVALAKKAIIADIPSIVVSSLLGTVAYEVANDLVNIERDLHIAQVEERDNELVPAE